MVQLIRVFMALSAGRVGVFVLQFATQTLVIHRVAVRRPRWRRRVQVVLAGRSDVESW